MTTKVLLSFLFLFSLEAMAQNSTGRIVGVITDPSGAVISGAKVVVTNTATNTRSETVSGADGTYQVLNLPIGNYTVSVEKEGFASVVTQPSELQINQTLRVDVHLAVGAVAQTVGVEAQATQVETEIPTIGGTVTGAAIQDLPLNGRNTLDLALTQPGVIPALNNSSNAAYVAGTFSIAGGRQDSVNYLLDGGNNTSVMINGVVLNPNPDMIAEFRILTNNYTAEYGRNAGGIVSVVTKSGTNQYHGSLFEYLRNEDFNANEYFNNAADLPRPILKRNQFGGTVGGPIKKDKLFYYFGYQGQRQTSIMVNPGVGVFTPAELQGDFSHAVNGGPDPGLVSFLRANPYFQPNPQLASQAIIAPSSINPVAQAVINAGLVPTSTDGVQIPNGLAMDNRDEYTGKIDFYATQNDRISATLGWANRTELNPYPGFVPNAGFPSHIVLDQRGINIAYTKTLSPTLINELRATAQRYIQLQDEQFQKYPSASTLGIAGVTPPPPGDLSAPDFTFDTGLNLGSPLYPELLYDTTYSFSDTITWIRGRHTFKAGFSFNVNLANAHIYNADGGDYYFYGPGGVGTGDNSFADFLLGIPTALYQGEQAQTYPRSKGYWSFVQDEWKVMPRLTLTLGLRYEFNTPLTDERGYNVEIIPGAQSQRFPNAPPGLVVQGDPGTPSGLYYPDYKEFAPRFGFAWDPRGNGRTSLRGGFGVFDDNIQGQLDFNYSGAAPPFFASVFLPLPPPTAPVPGTLNYMSQPYVAAGVPNPFPYPNPAPMNVNFAAAGLVPYTYYGFTSPNLKPPYIYQWNLSLQQQIGQTLVAEVSYLGNSAHRLTTFIEGNPMILGTDQRVLNVATAGDCAPYDCYQQLRTLDDLAHSNYNGMVASLTKRVGDWHSLGETFYTVSYTWSHMLDNADGWQGTGATQIPYYDHDQFYGNAANDVRQRLVISGGWEIPFAHLWPGGPKRLTSGWRLYPIFTKQSGEPLDVLAGLSNAGYTTPGPSGAGDQNLVRRNLAGSSVQTFNPAQVQTINGVTGNFFFNPNSFAPNPALWGTNVIPAPDQRTYGTYGRDSIYGPGFSNLDLSLEKRTALFGERVETAFRIEAFDVLNHAELWAPGTNSNSPFTFGVVTQTNPNSPSRILQLALRFNF
jgi:outer membrane receptor protein involved in Fe transport